MYSPQRVVGDFFEAKLMRIFDLSKSQTEELPDLVSRRKNFFMEVKASACTNGGVINKGQLERFDEEINVKRFYAFAYHSIIKNMGRNYATKDSLEDDLDLRSLYVFPFSIVFSYFQNSNKRKTPLHDTFVLMREKTADRIFSGEPETWKNLKLDIRQYKMARPHKKVRIITRNGNLEKELLNSFSAGAID